MLKIHKSIVFDESQRPAAVQIPIKEFERLEEIIENYGLAKLMDEVKDDERLSVKEAVEYIRDLDVDADLDRSLRDLLSICFTKSGDEVFRERRYFKEPPSHRWFIRNKEGCVIAHVALHEKVVVSSNQDIRVGGVADVCVHPEFRGQGFVRKILVEVHGWLRLNGYRFSLLFGVPRVYTSSEYVSVTNLFWKSKLDNGTVNWEPKAAMVCQLLETEWPTDNVYLRGQIF